MLYISFALFIPLLLDLSYFFSRNKTEQNTIKEKCVICVWKKRWYLYVCVYVFVLVFVIKICVCVNLKGFIAINSKFQNVYQNISLIWIKNRRLTKLTEVQMEPTSTNRWHLWRKGDTYEGKTLKFIYMFCIKICWNTAKSPRCERLYFSDPYGNHTR